MKSFAPVALVGEVANVLAVHPSFPAKTLKEFVDYCKAQGPNKVSYGSPAVGGTGHLAMEYLSELAGIKLEHVVYRGSSLVMKDLLAGHILDTMDNLPPYLQHIQSGALRALGVSSAKRWFAAPDVPTIAEQGYPGFDAAPWWYVAAPAGTPAEIVKKLSDEIIKGIKSEAGDQEDPRGRRRRAAGRRRGAGEADGVRERQMEEGHHGRQAGAAMTRDELEGQGPDRPRADRARGARPHADARACPVRHPPARHARRQRSRAGDHAGERLADQLRPRAEARRPQVHARPRGRRHARGRR